MQRNEKCPICLGFKEVYDGSEDAVSECTVCDENGEVSQVESLLLVEDHESLFTEF